MPVAKKATARVARGVVRELPEPQRPEPLIRLKRAAKPDAAAERVLLFTKEYDDPDSPDQEFWVPKTAMASMALKFMHLTRTEGDNFATAWAMEKVLGQEAYADLMEDDQLTDEELAMIFTLVQNAIIGATKDPKDKRR